MSAFFVTAVMSTFSLLVFLVLYFSVTRHTYTHVTVVWWKLDQKSSLDFDVPDEQPALELFVGLSEACASSMAGGKCSFYKVNII